MSEALTLTEVARRWRADRQTTRAALAAAGATPEPDHLRPAFARSTILRIEGWALNEIDQVDLARPLLRAEQIAATHKITTQTVRNHGRAGRLRAVRLSPRTIRYLPIGPCEAVRTIRQKCEDRAKCEEDAT